jgi:hypothetical protein
MSQNHKKWYIHTNGERYKKNSKNTKMVDPKNKKFQI